MENRPGRNRKRNSDVFVYIWIGHYHRCLISTIVAFFNVSYVEYFFNTYEINRFI